MNRTNGDSYFSIVSTNFSTCAHVSSTELRTKRSISFMNGNRRFFTPVNSTNAAADISSSGIIDEIDDFRSF